MNILVIGLGSMGQRRIRLLKESFNLHTISGVDLQEARRNHVETAYGVKAYPSIEEAVDAEKFDSAFVCTAPLFHRAIIDECLEYGMHIFTEINLVSDGYEELIKKAAKHNCKLFLSSTPIYRKEIQFITKQVKENHQRLNYRYHVGQYLPDWHPWESYKDFFVGDKRTNGCREIFAIELPWIINAFGPIISVNVLKSKNTDLDINYNDNYIVTVTHESGHKGVMCFDIVSRKAVRNIEVFGELLHLFWNGTPDSLVKFDVEKKIDETISTYDSVDKNANYSANIIENMYVDEIHAFMDYIEKGIVPPYSFEKDLEILNIIDEIEGE